MTTGTRQHAPVWTRPGRLERAKESLANVGTGVQQGLEELFTTIGVLLLMGVGVWALWCVGIVWLVKFALVGVLLVVLVGILASAGQPKP